MSNLPLTAPLKDYSPIGMPARFEQPKEQERRTRITQKAPSAQHIQELLKRGMTLEQLSALWGYEDKSIARWLVDGTDELPPFWTLDAARRIKRDMLGKTKLFVVTVPASQEETFKHLVGLGQMAYKELDF